MRIYHHRQSTHTFHRRISYVIDDEGKTVQYPVVQYLFSNGNEIPVVLLPHGMLREFQVPTVVHRRVHSLK